MTEPRLFLDGKVALYAGDCREVMARMDPASVDAVVCDPPYELGFMGRKWDSTGVAFAVETWAAARRVLKPGGHLLAFSAPRCVHRMAVAIEDAGFEIRDRAVRFMAADTAVAAFLDSLSAEQAAAFARCIEDSAFGGELAWVFGSGFPKSLDVSKAIDKAKGLAEQRGYVEATGGLHAGTGNTVGKFTGRQLGPDPVSDEARRWAGWGTALKPAYEPIVVARKPLAERNVAANVLAHGAGAINISGCRIESAGDGAGDVNGGRWPANVLHDGSPEVVDAFPAESGGGKGDLLFVSRVGIPGDRGKTKGGVFAATYADSGSAARFFWSGKADGDDRLGSSHPTVKPVSLMQWLVRLVTPAGGVVLDPFAGTGSTGEAAYREGCRAVLIEREEEYRRDIERRMDLVLAGPRTRRRAHIGRRTPEAADADPHGPGLFGGE